ncbi:IS982 family transposase [Amycolatopsis sp. NBC_00345]
MQALSGFTSEYRWLRYARAHLGHLFRYLPQQPGYNKRLRAAASLIASVIRMLAMDTTLWTDDVWVVDSTPVECGRSKDTVKRSDLAGWAEHGYCASHSRYFWGLRLHLVCTLGGLPVAFALTGAKADERQTLLDILHTDPTLTSERHGQTVIGDKNYFGAEFETELTAQGLDLLRPARKGRGRTPRGPVLQAAAPDHRIDQPDPQGPTGPGTARRTHPQRRSRPCPATHPRADCGDLAQRQDRRAGLPLPYGV